LHVWDLSNNELLEDYVINKWFKSDQSI
jgi:hypothetical protein